MSDLEVVRVTNASRILSSGIRLVTSGLTSKDPEAMRFNALLKWAGAA